MGNAKDALDELLPRLADALAANGTRFEARIDTRNDVEDCLLGSLATILLATARYAVPWKPCRLRARDRAGGDVEVRFDGIELPDGFPERTPDADLWKLAAGMLREHHRARLGQAEDRVLLLLPGRARARALRSTAEG